MSTPDWARPSQAEIEAQYIELYGRSPQDPPRIPDATAELIDEFDSTYRFSPYQRQELERRALAIAHAEDQEAITFDHVTRAFAQLSAEAVEANWSGDDW